MEIRKAHPDDNDAICQLMESVSMGSTIELIFERSPDYFLGAALQAEDVEIYVLTDDGRIVAIFSAGKRQVYVDHELRSVRYLCDLRLHPDYRSGLQLARGYRFLRDHVLREGEMMQTLILKDNQHGVSMLTSGRAGLPIYHPLGEYVTYFIPKQRLRATSGGVKVRRATADDINRMQICYDDLACQKQFAPVIDFSSIGRGAHYTGLGIGDFFVAERAGEVIGLCAIWDQAFARRIRVRKYRSVFLRWSRPFINLISRIALPPANGTVKTVYLYACVFDEVDVGKQLVGTALQTISSTQLLVIGLDKADPMQEVFERLSARTEIGFHYLVGFESIALPEGVFMFEAARI